MGKKKATPLLPGQTHLASFLRPVPRHVGQSASSSAASSSSTAPDPAVHATNPEAFHSRSGEDATMEDVPGADDMVDEMMTGGLSDEMMLEAVTEFEQKQQPASKFDMDVDTDELVISHTSTAEVAHSQSALVSAHEEEVLPPTQYSSTSLESGAKRFEPLFPPIDSRTLADEPSSSASRTPTLGDCSSSDDASFQDDLLPPTQHDMTTLGPDIQRFVPLFPPTDSDTSTRADPLSLAETSGYIDDETLSSTQDSEFGQQAGVKPFVPLSTDDVQYDSDDDDTRSSDGFSSSSGEDWSDSDGEVVKADRSPPFRPEDRKHLFSEIRRLVDTSKDLKKLELKDLPVVHLPADPELLFWKFDAKHISLLEKDGHVLKDAVHKEYCILLGFCQSARIAATIENGSITNAKWRRKLARWLSATDWNLLHKVSGSALSTLEEVRSLKGLDRADAFISYAAKKEASQHVAKILRDYEGKLHESFGLYLKELDGPRTVELPKLQFRLSDAKALRQNEKQDACKQALESFSRLRKAVQQRGDLAVEGVRSNWTHYQLAEFIAVLLRETADATRVSYVIFKREFTSERIAELLVRLATLPAEALYNVKMADILSKDDLATYDAGTRKEAERVAKYRAKDAGGSSVPPAAPNKAALYHATRRGFLKRVANSTLVRAGVAARGPDGKRNPAAKKHVDEIFVHLCNALEVQKDRCNLCGAKMTTLQTIHQVKSSKRRRMDRKPSNVSVDRIIPGARGGGYDPANLQAICVGCNIFKGMVSNAEARERIQRFAEVISVCPREDGFACWPAEPRTLGAAGEGAVRAWARGQSESLDRRCNQSKPGRKPKTCTITETDLRQLARARMISDTELRDVTGFVVPLSNVSVDRLDPDRGYDLDNVRLLSWAANWLRSDGEDDSSLFAYGSQVCQGLGLSPSIKKLAC